MASRSGLFFLAGFFIVSISVECQHAPPPLSNTNPQMVQRSGAPAEASIIEQRGDELRAEKRYFDAIDSYGAALIERPNDSALYNKLGICELLLGQFKRARLDFKRAIRLDAHYATAYNNLGVLYYSYKKYGKSIKQYDKAISLDPDSASYYSNLGSAYFSKKEWDKSIGAFTQAVAIDPEIFEHNNAGGTVGQIASPQDHAHFFYVLARLYAKNGWNERSLECLRRAMEEGYKGVADVYKDTEFGQLRKDPRFDQLMASHPVSISE